MDNNLFGGGESGGGGLDLFGGKGTGDKEFGRSQATSTIGGDTYGVQLDKTTLITVAAIAGAALILLGVIFRR